MGVIIQLIRANIPNMHLPATSPFPHVKKKRHRSFSHQNHILPPTEEKKKYTKWYYIFSLFLELLMTVHALKKKIKIAAIQ